MSEFYQDMHEAQRAKKDAIERVDAHADDSWKARAMNAVKHLARHRQQFTTDEVWAIVETNREPRAMGAVMQKACKAGTIEKTNTTRQSVRVECHGRDVRVWRSLCYMHGDD